MISLLLRGYVAFPWRTHCTGNRHTPACRICDPLLAVFQNDRRCGKPPRPPLP